MIKIYDKEHLPRLNVNQPIIQVIKTEATEALNIFRTKGKCCILSFADYYVPGGTYGSDNVEWTQEECLCRDIPWLYPALCEQEKAADDFAVVSCAAPLEGSFKERATFVLDIMEENNVEIPILGWWSLWER